MFLFLHGSPPSPFRDEFPPCPERFFSCVVLCPDSHVGSPLSFVPVFFFCYRSCYLPYLSVFSFFKFLTFPGDHVSPLFSSSTSILGVRRPPFITCLPYSANFPVVPGPRLSCPCIWLGLFFPSWSLTSCLPSG